MAGLFSYPGLIAEFGRESCELLRSAQGEQDHFDRSKAYIRVARGILSYEYP